MYTYSLNKIDVEIRQMVKDASKEGKVHGSTDILKYDKYRKQREDEKKRQNFKDKLYKYKGKKKITIDAVKVRKVKVEGFKQCDSKDGISSGRFLDTEG